MSQVEMCVSFHPDLQDVINVGRDKVEVISRLSIHADSTIIALALSTTASPPVTTHATSSENASLRL